MSSFTRSHKKERSAEGVALQDGKSIPCENEHILVCLSSALANAKAIRAAAQMALALGGSFTALFVETPNSVDLKGNSQTILQDNFRLAEQLGARVATVYGEDVATQIAEYAKASIVTRIVLGRSTQTKRCLKKHSIINRLMVKMPNLNICIIPDEPLPKRNIGQRFNPITLTVTDTLKFITLLAVCTMVGEILVPMGFREANVMTIYILGVLLNSIFTSGWIYGLVYSVCSVLAYNYFFTYPIFSFDFHGSGGIITFLVMFIAAFITSTLMKKVKIQARQAAQKAYRTEVLLEANRKLQQAEGKSEILKETAKQLIKLLDKAIIVYSVDHTGLSEPELFFKIQDQDYLSSYERNAAQWVYQNHKHAGATTDILPDAKCLYLAVRGGNRVLAVVGVAMDEVSPIDPFEKNLMFAILGECAFALERERLDKAQKLTEIRVDQELLRANLLRMISHDLRTPLTSINGNAGILLNNSSVLTEKQKKDLYSTIYEDARWLTNLVENLLSIARIEDRKIPLKLQPELLEDVFDEALLHINRDSVGHHITSVLSNDLLMAKMDSRLVIQIIINLVNNAVKYTPPGSHIQVSAKQENAFVLVEVSDDGPGISDEEKKKIFDLFYTANNERGDGRRGLGLGLHLCRAIAEAHGGTITVKDNEPQGCIFGFTLQARGGKDS